jgi:hypothetical protein
MLITFPTLLYWYWESSAEGNIRVDLLVIYPTLFLIYLSVLFVLLARKKFGFISSLSAILFSILGAAALMGINYLFLMISYDLFDKNPG